jgi:hypothetical protein
MLQKEYGLQEYDAEVTIVNFLLRLTTLKLLLVEAVRAHAVVTRRSSLIV